MCFKARFCLRIDGDTLEVASKILDQDDPFQAFYAARKIATSLMPAFKAQGFEPTQVEVHLDRYDPQIPMFANMVQHSGAWVWSKDKPTLATLNTATKPVVVS